MELANETLWSGRNFAGLLQIQWKYSIIRWNSTLTSERCLYWVARQCTHVTVVRTGFFVVHCRFVANIWFLQSHMSAWWTLVWENSTSYLLETMNSVFLLYKIMLTGKNRFYLQWAQTSDGDLQWYVAQLKHFKLWQLSRESCSQPRNPRLLSITSWHCVCFTWGC